MPSRPLTDNEAASLLTQTDNPMHQSLIALGIRTGFRISELLSLTVANVTQAGGSIVDEITVKRSCMKGKRQSRTVVLHQEAKMYLKAYIVGAGLGADSKLFPISRFTANRLMKSVAAAAGLEGRISCHSMRKSFGMKVYLRTGKDVVAAQRALGHASLSSTTRYLSVGQEVIDQAILAD